MQTSSSLDHEPVMPSEVVTMLKAEGGGSFVDYTVGAGGHTSRLLEAGVERVLGFDRDADALKKAANNLNHWHDSVELVHSDFRQFVHVLNDRGIQSIDGALADLGVSTMQLDGHERGFSFRKDEPLDMRMDRSVGPTAAEMLSAVSESDLADVIYRFGEDRHARRIARLFVSTRDHTDIKTTGQLAEVVRRAVARRGYQRIDPATRTFQAVRIWVNREVEGLDEWLGGSDGNGYPEEHQLATHIAQRCASHFSFVLQSIAERMAHAAGRTADRNVMPVSPQQISYHFIVSCRSIQLEPNEAKIVEDLFHRFVLDRLGGVYGSINQKLIEAGYLTLEDREEFSVSTA